MLFSATLSNRVMELAYEHMNNPQVIRIEAEHVTADNVRQALYHVSAHDKIALLLGVLRQQEPKRIMIFVNTKRAADRVTGYLLGNGYEAGVLSGDIPQHKRLKLLEAFQRGELPILVATDVAARGLHIADVTHVINFDLPQEREDYVHRIGRTARVGASGDAISFACETVRLLAAGDRGLHRPEDSGAADHRGTAGGVQAAPADGAASAAAGGRRARVAVARRTGGRPTVA